jgi:hypothetical protein
MSGQAYVGTAKRTFAQALLHLLETDYGLLGSHKILELLVADVEELVEQFFPIPERLRPGWMVFTGTKASGSKAYPGQSAADHALVTLAWPVLLSEDVQQLARGLPNPSARLQWFQNRLVRLVEYGLNHSEGPVLLTLADLSAMLGLDTVVISKLLEEARQSTGKTLLTKGYFFDQGMRPTHKEAVVDLYEQGLDEVTIARHTHHAQSSVGRYLRDYERVKLLRKRQIPPEEMIRLLDMQPNVVKTYLSFVEKYHPMLD